MATKSSKKATQKRRVKVNGVSSKARTLSKKDARKVKGGLIALLAPVKGEPRFK